MGLFDLLVTDLPPMPEPRSQVVSVLDASGLLQTAGASEVTEIDLEKGFRGAPVQWSHDLDRIVNLPRRSLDPKDPRAADAWTKHLRRERTTPCDCVERWGFCITSLRAIQGWGLEEASNAQGFLGPIGVGHGKEGLCLLAPLAFDNCKRAVLFMPANLRPQFLQRDYPQWSAHFNVPSLSGVTIHPGMPVLTVMSYNDLSSPKATDVLSMLAPDLIILNEAQNLSSPNATRTKRFRRYFSEAFAKAKQDPKFTRPRLFATSGTLTKRSLKDYAHFAELGLGENSPLPLHYPTVEEWAGAIDATDAPAPMGELRRLCRDGETARQGFRRRLTDTRGVVGTEESALDTLLVLRERKIANTPTEISDLINGVEKSWQRPDGEELIDPLQKAIASRQLASGFFYRWTFPRGEQRETIERWLAVRKEWHSELRTKLKRSTEHMDSPLLVTQAAIRWHDGYTFSDGQHYHEQKCYDFNDPQDHRHTSACDYGCAIHFDFPTKCGKVEGAGRRVQIPPHTKNGPLKTWESEFWPLWREVRNTVEPETEPVWVNRFLVEDCAAWARENVGIVWYDYDCFGREVAKLAQLPHYGGGAKASAAILGEKGNRSIVASVRAHGTGKNLQCFSRNLFPNPMSDGAAWEQTLARTHRPGQRAEEVSADIYRHTVAMREAFDEALSRAEYIQSTMGGTQKLLYATIEFALWR
jgi:hypothetical protein